jgi:hypothetical protein
MGELMDKLMLSPEYVEIVNLWRSATPEERKDIERILMEFATGPLN